MKTLQTVLEVLVVLGLIVAWDKFRRWGRPW
jgi:hypothetical protein